MMSRLFLMGGLVTCLVSGCLSPKFIANNMTGTMADVRTAFFAEESAEHAFHAGPGLLMQLDGFIVSSPRNSALLLSAAELNCGYALTFLDMHHPEWAQQVYSKGKRYALRALAEVNPDLYEAIAKDDEAAVAAALIGLDREKELPVVFWTGVCWGGLINVAQDADLAADLPMVEKLIGASLALDPEFYFGAGHSFYGVLYAGRTEMLGGNLAKGKEHFDKALELMDGTFLLTKVLYARYYAVSAQDAKLYVRLLTEVTEDDSAEPPDMRLANAVARRDAAWMLSRVGDLFPGYEGGGDLGLGAGTLEEDDIDDLDLD
jgi:hypothetical protein